MTAPGAPLLVTGGAGYLGGVLVPHLLALGYRVRVLDSLLFGDAALVAVRGHPGFELQVGDVRDAAAVGRAVRGVEAVVHLAGFANDPSGELDPAETVAVNLDATALVVESAKRAGARRLVFASSPSVYGACPLEEATEDAPAAPLTWYARTKWQAEAVVRGANDARFVATSVRPGTLCGRSPRQRLDLVVNLLTSHAAARGRMTVFGGAQARPHLHLADAAELFALVLRADGARVGGEVFNAASESCTVAEVARRVRSVVGEHVTIETAATKDERSYHLSSEKVARVLGFRPARKIEVGIAEVRDAFRSGALADPDDPRWHNVRRLREPGVRSSGQ